MSSSKKVSRTVVVREVREGDVVRMVAPDGKDHDFEVTQASAPFAQGVSGKEYVRLTVDPGFAKGFTESRLLGADRDLELVERKGGGS